MAAFQRLARPTITYWDGNYNFLGANYNVSGANSNLSGARVHSRERPRSDYNFLGARPSQAEPEGSSRVQGYGLAVLGACQEETKGQAKGPTITFWVRKREKRSVHSIG